MRDQNRIVQQRIDMPEQLKVVGTESVDLLASIDPGSRNTGLAIFIRDKENPKRLKLETATQLEFDTKYEWWMVPSYLLGAIYRIAMDFNEVYRRLDGMTPVRINKIGIVIEQAVGKNNDQKKFIFGMQSCVVAMMPWSPFKTFIKIVSAKTVREQLKLPHPPAGLRPSKAWETRKTITLNHVQANLGVVVPRHDTSDAIALGVAALMAGRIRLASTPFRDACLDAWFIPEEVLQEELRKRNESEDTPKLVIQGPENTVVAEPDEIHSMQRLQDDDDSSSSTDYGSEEEKYDFSRTEGYDCL